MTREEMVLSKVQYWGMHLGDHMFGTHERPKDDADAYRASRFVVNVIYIYADNKEVRLIGRSYGHDGRGKGRERNTTSVLPKRFTQLLKLVAFPEIIE